MRGILKLVKQAILDYSMLQNNDRVLIAVSGGKDSMLLTHILLLLKKYIKLDFELCAFILDNGFANTNTATLIEYCNNLGVPAIAQYTKISEIIEGPKKNKYPCSLCSRLRKGIIADYAAKQQFNKIAFGHHLDDAIATFFLNIIYEARLNIFEPITHLTRKNIFLIRPLIYLTEQQIKSVVTAQKIPVFKNPCPMNNNTKRASVNKFIELLAVENPNIRSQFLTAFKNKNQFSMWF